MSRPRIVEEKAIEIGAQDLHEYLSRDVERWIEENKAAHGARVSKESLYLHLAEKLDITPRQLKRYMDGATEISLKKAVGLCNEIGLKGVFEAANYEVGLEACELPALPTSECDNYDAAEELVKSVKAFSEQAVVLAKSMNEKASVATLQKIRATSQAARKQILKCERLYHEMLNQKAIAEHQRAEDARKKRVSKKADEMRRVGQKGLFSED